jgi:hypothetical protein
VESLFTTYRRWPAENILASYGDQKLILVLSKARQAKSKPVESTHTPRHPIPLASMSVTMLPPIFAVTGVKLAKPMFTELRVLIPKS